MSEIKVRPGSDRWNQLVAIGIVKDADRNWFLGDAALEIAPATWDKMLDGTSTPAFSSGEEALLTLHQYANAIGADHYRLALYRQTAAYWPPETRVEGTSWKVHQMLVRHQALIKPGMTVTQAHEALGHSTAGRGGLVGRLEEQRRIGDELRKRNAREELTEREKRDDLSPRLEWVATVLNGVRREMAETKGLTDKHRTRIHASALQVGKELVELIHENGVGDVDSELKALLEQEASS